MRLLLAIFALIGLLLSPVAASAAARECVDASEPMMMQMTGVGLSGDHHCCPDDAKPGPSPTKHDAKSCAAACAVMGGVTVAVPAESQFFVLAPQGRAPHEAVPAKAVRAYAPPGLERPPRTIA